MGSPHSELAEFYIRTGKPSRKFSAGARALTGKARKRILTEGSKCVILYLVDVQRGNEEPAFTSASRPPSGPCGETKGGASLVWLSAQNSSIVSSGSWDGKRRKANGREPKRRQYRGEPWRSRLEEQTNINDFLHRTEPKLY